MVGKVDVCDHGNPWKAKVCDGRQNNLLTRCQARLRQGLKLFHFGHYQTPAAEFQLIGNVLCCDVELKHEYAGEMYVCLQAGS
jgi:hypothetical protein